MDLLTSSFDPQHSTTQALKGLQSNHMSETQKHDATLPVDTSSWFVVWNFQGRQERWGESAEGEGSIANAGAT